MLRGVQVKMHITNTQQETCTARETGKQLKMFIVNVDAEQATFEVLCQMFPFGQVTIIISKLVCPVCHHKKEHLARCHCMNVCRRSQYTKKVNAFCTQRLSVWIKKIRQHNVEQENHENCDNFYGKKKVVTLKKCS